MNRLSPTDSPPEVTWQHVNCAFCGRDNAKFFRHEGWQFPTYEVRCVHCGLVYLQPRPQLNEAYISDLYKGRASLLDQYKVDEHFTLEQLRPHHRQRYVDSLEAILTAHPATGTLIDVGAGNGALLSLAQQRGWKAIGVEISKEHSGFCREQLHLDVRTGTLESACFPAASADAIAMRHVLEHVEDPVGMLREAHRILRANGVLLLEVPNPSSFEKNARRILYNVIHGKRVWRPVRRLPMHLFAFPPKTLIAKVQEIGFNVVSCCTYSYPEHHTQLVFALLRIYHRLCMGTKTRLVLRKR